MKFTIVPTQEITGRKRREDLLAEEAELKKRMIDTDWYVIRSIETGEPIPTEIRSIRETARNRISEIRVSINSSETNG